MPDPVEIYVLFELSNHNTLGRGSHWRHTYRDRNVTWGTRQMTIKETRYNSAAREWFDAHPEEEAAE